MRRIYLQKAKTQVARSNTIRNINSRIVLTYVREREPISRAEIAKETALQRSTVSSIVSSLLDEGFIEEVGTGSSSGGRKPTMLQLRRDEAVAIGVDITPTVTTIASANLAGKIVERETFQTSADSDEMSRLLILHLKKFKSKLKSESVEIGVSVPGMVDESNGVVTYVPYFQWNNWKLKQNLERAVGLPVVLDNDANAAALAELWFGRPEARGVKNFVSVLVVDGIGAGIIFEGQIYRGNQGAAGEFGHMIIGGENHVRCSCGNTQCWEAFASNTATVSRYAALNNSKNGKSAASIDEIFRLAAQNDKAALKTVLDTTEYLGLGIVNLIVGLSPEAVIISGKITLIWDKIEKKLVETIKNNIRQKMPQISIIASTLGDSPTLTGAISLSLLNKFASTT